jgi:hypothetical protein
MIIVRLKGGLGNQMFQYAFGRRLALDNDVPLKLDTVSGFENDFYKRSYGLGHFRIVENIASREEVMRFRRIESSGLRGWLYRLINLFRRRSQRHSVLREHRVSRFDLRVLKGSTNVLIDGYWQSEKYFQPINDLIRKEFQVKSPLEDLNLVLANEIRKSNSVCLHLRRYSASGNEVNCSAVKKHGVLSPEYYYRGLRYLTNRQSKLHCFVFSDSPDWTEENLRLSCPSTFVTHNHEKGKDYEDLRLMSLCKHHIIANSTFSWWGAWLCTYPEKIVIAPKRWFKEPGRDTRDLIPDSWYRI